MQQWVDQAGDETICTSISPAWFVMMTHSLHHDAINNGVKYNLLPYKTPLALLVHPDGMVLSVHRFTSVMCTYNDVI